MEQARQSCDCSRRELSPIHTFLLARWLNIGKQTLIFSAASRSEPSGIHVERSTNPFAVDVRNRSSVQEKFSIDNDVIMSVVCFPSSKDSVVILSAMHRIPREHCVVGDWKTGKGYGHCACHNPRI